MNAIKCRLYSASYALIRHQARSNFVSFDALVKTKSGILAQCLFAFTEPEPRYSTKNFHFSLYMRSDSFQNLYASEIHITPSLH